MTGADLLGRTLELLAAGGRAPVSVDVTIVCERPAIAPRRLELRERLGPDLGSGGRSRLRQGDPSGGAGADRRRHRMPGARGGRVSEQLVTGRRAVVEAIRAGSGPRGARRGRGAGHPRAPGGARGGPRGQGARPRDGSAGAGPDRRRSPWGRRADDWVAARAAGSWGSGTSRPSRSHRMRSSSSWTGSRIRRTSGPRRGRPRRPAPRPSSPGARRAAGVTPAAVRASAGALEHLPHAVVANIAASARAAAGRRVLRGRARRRRSSLDLRRAVSAGTRRGGDGIGGSGDVPARARTVRCARGAPLRGRVGSLNASAALAAALYGFVLRRDVVASPRSPG